MAKDTSNGLIPSNKVAKPPKTPTAAGYNTTGCSSVVRATALCTADFEKSARWIFFSFVILKDKAYLGAYDL